MSLLEVMDCWRSIEIEIDDNANLFDPDFDPEKDIST